MKSLVFSLFVLVSIGSAQAQAQYNLARCQPLNGMITFSGQGALINPYQVKVGKFPSGEMYGSVTTPGTYANQGYFHYQDKGSELGFLQVTADENGSIFGILQLTSLAIKWIHSQVSEPICVSSISLDADVVHNYIYSARVYLNLENGSVVGPLQF